MACNSDKPLDEVACNADRPFQEIGGNSDIRIFDFFFLACNSDARVNRYDIINNKLFLENSACRHTGSRILVMSLVYNNNKR